jgi:AcrR family transcriptional regulator
MDNKDKILQAALAVFAEVGFRGATTRRIAQEAGVNEITLFRHFGSKDRLLHEAIKRSDLKQECGARLPEEPRRPRAELLAWGREHMTHLLQVRSLMCTCLAEMDAHPEIIPRNSPSTESVARLKDYLRKLKSRGFTSAQFDPEIVAPAFLGVLFADAMGRRFMPDLYSRTPDKTLEGYVDFFLRGLGIERNAGTIRQERAS